MPSRKISSIWDFLRDNRAILDPYAAGVWAIFCWDPFIEKIILYNLKHNYKKNSSKSFKVIVGSQVTKDWVEDTFNSLSLFGNSDSYLVLNADEIPDNAQELILSIDKEIIGRLFVLFFAKKSNIILPSKTNNQLLFEAPPFWDQRKLLDFIAQEMRITLSSDVLNFVYEIIEPTPANFVMALNILRLNLFAGPMDRNQIQGLLTVSKLDQFLLADYLNEKSWSDLYSYLLSVPMDQGAYAKTFAFLVSHLLKLKDPSYVSKKARPSKYDLRIEQISKAWQPKEIDDAIYTFGQLALSSRSGTEHLVHVLRTALLKNYYQN